MAEESDVLKYSEQMDSAQPGITGVRITGYKSLLDMTMVELRPLTVFVTIRLR